MALPSTGPISMSQVNTELGRTSTASINLNDTQVRSLAGVASGAISMSNLRGKSWWVLKTGSYASSSQVVDGRWVTSYTHTFAAVRPKTLAASGWIQQLDWDAWVSYSIEVNYVTSGWVTVASASTPLAQNGVWNWSNNAEMTREELATQWRINVSARANNGTQTVGFSQWYTQG